MFTISGLVLESLHAFKMRAYIDVSNETRRLMWTLAHAHGTLLSVVHVIFALTVRALPEIDSQVQRLVSRCLILASILLPGGFFVGGIVIYGGDPGLGIVTVPAGAALLLIAIFVLARAVASDAAPGDPVRPRAAKAARDRTDRGHR